MARAISDIAFTPAVKVVQERLGSRAGTPAWRRGAAPLAGPGDR